MWREPEVHHINNFASLMSAYYMQMPFLEEMRFPIPDDDPALARLYKWTNTINEAVRGGLEMRDPNALYPWYREFILGEARKIHDADEYALIPEMMKQVSIISGGYVSQDKIPPALRELWQTLLSQVMTLLGDKRTVLVGVRDGVPAWKGVSEVQDRELTGRMMSSFIASYGFMECVDQACVWMVPDHRIFDIHCYRKYERDREYIEVTRGLLEAAYYGQHYVIDPDGVYVKFTDAGDVTGMYLKVRDRRGSEFSEILVRAETARGGAVFFVLDEESLLEPSRKMARFWAGSYVGALAAQVYHDLVTVADVAANGEQQSSIIVPTGKHGREPLSHENRFVSWRVLPRKKGKFMYTARGRAAGSTARAASEPHRVTGHLRNAPLSDTHREELKRFEATTGLEVLRFIPEGYTFVRPHVSPRASADDVLALPRFIRFRIQQRLEGALTARSPALS